jgi:hypothetical protein
MARGLCSFKIRDVTRVLKATATAGVKVKRIEIDRMGKIVIVTGEPEGDPNDDANSWDKALSRDDHQALSLRPKLWRLAATDAQRGRALHQSRRAEAHGRAGHFANGNLPTRHAALTHGEKGMKHQQDESQLVCGNDKLAVGCMLRHERESEGNSMYRLMLSVLFGLAPIVAVAAEPSEPAAQPKCETAEINPVTGHVFCITPLGAPVEAPPPPEAKPPCKPEDARGQWSYGPNCTVEPGGM